MPSFGSALLAPLTRVLPNGAGRSSLDSARLTLLARRLSQRLRISPLHCDPVRLFLGVHERHSELLSAGLEMPLSSVHLNLSFIGQPIALVGDCIPGVCGGIAAGGNFVSPIGGGLSPFGLPRRFVSLRLRHDPTIYLV